MAEAEQRVQSMPHHRLDRDPSRCAFDLQRHAARTVSDSKHSVSFRNRNNLQFVVLVLGYDRLKAPHDDDAENGDVPTLVAALPVKERPPPMSTGNQYWMPDHLCKVCYDCSSAFSFFRRRHHCRLCGQIFCHECSNHFIDGIPHGFPGVVRVCEFCFQFADAVGGKKKKVGEYEQGHHVMKRLDGNETSRESLSGRFDGLPRRLSGESGSAKPSPLVFGPFFDRIDAPLSLSPVESNASDLTGLGQPADPTTLTIESVDLFEESETVEARRRFCPQVRTRRRHSSAELLGAIESGGLGTEMLALHNRTKKFSAEKDVSTVLEEVPWITHIHNTNDFHTQRDIALDQYMQTAHKQICDGIEHSASSVPNSLLESESIGLEHLAETLQDIAFVVTGHLLYSMNFRSINGFNYANLVKVKSIAVGVTVQTNKKEPSYNFKWLAGTVCRKHLSHKQMARHVENPRILLFACGISYDRSSGAGRMSSLDTLLEQEKRYMAILVEKISKLEPDVIFVEKTVSRHAQELLCERRISIVLNVKSELLHRIARHTGAEVLTSVDHVDKANSAQVIGRCRSFRVKSIPVVLDAGLSPTKKPKALGGVLLKASAVSNRLRTDTYLYLDGCDPLNGCTVLITGPSKQTLRLLKQLTRTVLLMTYQSLLEAHVLCDLGLNNGMVMPSIEITGLSAEQRTTWLTTSTLHVRDPGSPNPRYQQCIEAKHLKITACSDDDVSFGNFLNQELAALTLKCQSVKCNHLMADHVHSFSCRTGTITIAFEELPIQDKRPLSLSVINMSDVGATEKLFGSFSELSFTMSSEKNTNLRAMMTADSVPRTSENDDDTVVSVENCYPTVIFWRWCRECNSMITPFMPLEKYIYKYSFARFLEVLFSEAEQSVQPKSFRSTCTHTSMESHVLFLNIGKFVARFDFSKKVSLRLSHATFKRGSDRRHSKQAFTKIEQAVVKKEVAARLEILKDLLRSLIGTFTKKLQGINQAVEAFKRMDRGYNARIILEVMCMCKMVQSGDAVFSHQMALIGEKLADSLGTCDVTQRELYLIACKWITCMLRLRKLIKKHLSTSAALPASSSGSFILGGITFHPPALLSPIPFLQVAEESTLAPSTIVKESDWSKDTEHLAQHRSGGALSSVTESESSTGMILPSSKTVASFESSKRPSLPFPVGDKNNGDGKEGPRIGWKEALWDLYRVLGRTEPGSDFTIDLPELLTAGHPSLPHRSKSRVVLVDEAKPITSVAYALSTDSYEEEMDGWKLRVHNEAVESVALQKQKLDDASAVTTNWSRAALETSLSVPFKFVTMEMPLHLSLLSDKSSCVLPSTCWELSMIAYFPLQFEVLRELFYGSLQTYLFSISHVASWDADGGKSGASFYRTLDDRFVVKHITSTEMQSFLGCLPDYFRYMASIYFDGLASLLSKTVGLYQTTTTRKDTGQKMVHYICVMENVFYQKQPTRTYDLKGSSRNRFTKPQPTSEALPDTSHVLLDGNLLEFTKGHPLGILAEDHRLMLKAVQNDTAFLCSINIVDYSMVLGLCYRHDDTGDQEGTLSEMTVGIIDYLRQFDLIKRVESVSKSVGMIAGQSSPTIIEPGLYGKRFQDAMRRYFMPVTPISSGTNDDN